MPIRYEPARLLRAAAILAAAAGVGAWSAVLLAPQPRALPPMLTAPPPAGASAPLAQWFGSSAASVKVAVLGVIAAGERGAAILRIDGGAPQAYRVGQSIADGVTLARVERNGVVLDQAGAPIRVDAPAAPVMPAPGFVRVQP